VREHSRATVRKLNAAFTVPLGVTSERVRRGYAIERLDQLCDGLLAKFFGTLSASRDYYLVCSIAMFAVKL
jgi:hypothetical protein